MSKEIDFEGAKHIGEERRKMILSNFGVEDNLEKSIHPIEFAAKYGSHEVFTAENLNEYIAKSTENGTTDEVVKAITDEFAGLTKVLVKGKDGLESKYVRKAKSSEQEEESKEEDSKEETEENEESED